MHVAERDDFILNLVSANFAPIEAQKLIISKLRPYADTSQKVARFDLVVSLVHAQSTNVS
jgi:hypothetical protein